MAFTTWFDVQSILKLRHAKKNYIQLEIVIGNHLSEFWVGTAEVKVLKYLHLKWKNLTKRLDNQKTKIIWSTSFVTGWELECYFHGISSTMLMDTGNISLETLPMKPSQVKNKNSGLQICQLSLWLQILHFFSSMPSLVTSYRKN